MKTIGKTHPTIWKESQKEEYIPTKELKEQIDFYPYLLSLQKLIQKHTIDKAVLRQKLIAKCETSGSLIVHNIIDLLIYLELEEKEK